MRDGIADMTLKELKKGRSARISSIAAVTKELDVKLREIGFSEGDEVELLERGPFGGGAIAVRLNRTIIALRAVEAAAINVEEIA